jgi:diguanylate cyclase (GGDEF)-like protein/PAS domain S-box-containing protein
MKTLPTDFFQFASALMCVLDAQGKILQINPAWEKQFNVVDYDVEQSDYLDWVHSADKTSTSACLAQLGMQLPNSTTHLAQSSSTVTSYSSRVNFANRWRDCAGHYHWLNWEISSTPQHQYFYAVATDITEQKRVEKILHDTEERFELAIKGSEHGLWDWNLETNEIYLSPRWKKMLGYQDDEITNHLDGWIKFVHPDDFTQMWRVIEAYLDHELTHYEGVYRVCHKDGQYRWILARAAALWDEEGQPYRMVGTYTDITEKKRIEQALQESEILLSAIFEVTKIGLCVINERGLFIRVNPAYCELYGYSTKELLGQHFTCVLPQSQHAQFLKLYQAWLEGDPEVETAGEWCIQNSMGHTTDVSFTIGRLNLPNGYHYCVIALSDITKRKHDEAERYRLFNLSLDMQSIIGFDMTFKEVNAAWECTLGWSKAELLKRSPLALVHPNDRDISLKTIQQLTQGKTISGFENRYLCKDGAYKWLSWNIYPLVDQQTLYVVTRDITERKRAEAEIKQQQAFTRLVVDSVPNLIFIKDRWGNFIFVNQPVADLFGVSIEKLVQQKNHDSEYLTHFFTPADQEVIENQSEVTIEASYYNTQGKQLHFHLVKRAFRQANGETLVLSVGTDITERKQQEQALKLSETRYRAIIQDQTDLICRFLPDGTLTFVNQAYCDYFGQSESELLGKPFTLLMSTENKQHFDQRLAHLTPISPVIVGEHNIHLPDGTIRWQQWIDRAMFNSQGQIIEYQAVGRDITQRKQAEEALHQSEERLRVITSAAPVILFAIDNKGIITFLRGKALQAFSLTDDELVGQSIFNTFVYLPKQLEDFHRVLVGETVTTLIQLPQFILETKLTPLYDEESKVIGAIGVAVDISERYRLENRLKDTVAELKTILDNSVVGIAYLKSGIFIRVNNKLEDLLGFSHNELYGLPFSTIYPSYEDYQRMENQAYRLFEQDQEYRAEQIIQTRDGKVFWSRIVGKAVDANDLTKGTIWIMEDISVQKEAQQHLRLTAVIFETSANAIMVTDLKNRILRVNPAFTKITGFTFKEVYGRKTNCLSSGQHNKQYYEKMWRQIKKTGHWQGEIWNRKKTGEVYVAWLAISVITNEKGIPTQYMAILTDISSLQEDIEQVRYLANYDSLTRLPNRLLFHDNLLQAQKLANRNKRLFALLFIDLDGFKPINDTLGHAIGDQLLQGVAQRLQNCIRETDTIARLGGDEFTIILNNIKKPQDAAKVANHVLQHLQKPFQLSGHTVNIAASIGISLYPYNSREVDNLIKQADKAMYEAKHAGKGRYCFYDPVLDQE